MKILLANPRGFCAGVKRAINIVESALMIYGAPIYVHHEIIHNSYVISNLQNRGIIFIEKVSEVPDYAILIFSAHGVSQSVRAEAKARNLTMLFDATCPLVTKVHIKVACASRKGVEVVFIGHSGHPEVDGSMGQYNNPNGGIYLVESSQDVFNLKVKNENNLVFMTQTTLSIDEVSDLVNALRQRFPAIIGPRRDDICYATANRQKAIHLLTNDADIILVVGSMNSSNSNRLVEVAQRTGKLAKLIDSVNDINIEWFKNVKCIGLTAGASVPDILVQHVIQYLRVIGGKIVIELIGHEKDIVFKVPKELRVNIRKI